MKIINKILPGLLILAAFTFISCDKEEYNFTGDSTARIYFTSYYQGLNTFGFSVLHTPLGSWGLINASFPVRSTQKADAAINVSLAIDNSLAEAFNLKNGTNYSTVPSGLAELSTSSLVIPVGAYLSSDSVKVTISEDVVAQLTATGYIIPVRITSINTTEDAEISSNLNTIYIIVKTDWSNCYNGQVLANMVGILISPRTGWSASINVPLYSGNLGQLFDGSTNSYWQIRPSAKFILTVDLASEYVAIAGIRTNTSSTNYGLTQAKVYSSVDNLSWTYQGTPTFSTSSAYQYVRFYAPITARYLRIESVSTRSTSRIYMGEFDVYRNQL